VELYEAVQRLLHENQIFKNYLLKIQEKIEFLTNFWYFQKQL
jgi:hypothetical protein